MLNRNAIDQLPVPITPPLPRVSGTTMLEVLVTIVILASGLLGLAALQVALLTAEAESYQRAQAILLVNDMVERVTTNRSAAASYVSTDVFGTDGMEPIINVPFRCAVSPATQVSRDLCDWGRSLQGAAEKKTVGSVITQVGGLGGGRGCIQLVQAEDATPGVCKPGIYRVTVAWQGSNKTTEPA
ncbi:MAG: type IV pilus modification protein PilV, partial [Aeromicrobium sp.]|nr:type IV pilus modification protein PilV [Burkholderiales bacterium]